MIDLSRVWVRWTCLGVLALALTACSSSPDKAKPAALPDVSGQLGVQKAWSSTIGPVSTPLFASVHVDRVAVASTTGHVALIDGQTGQDVWRLQLDTPIQAGVGGDGQRFAVITRTNEVVAIEAGKVIWRHRLSAMSYTAPLVAGGRVFVLTADRSVTALDGATGQKTLEPATHWRSLGVATSRFTDPFWRYFVGGLGRPFGLFEPEYGRCALGDTGRILAWHQ